MVSGWGVKPQHPSAAKNQVPIEKGIATKGTKNTKNLGRWVIQPFVPFAFFVANSFRRLR